MHYYAYILYIQVHLDLLYKQEKGDLHSIKAVFINNYQLRS